MNNHVIGNYEATDLSVPDPLLVKEGLEYAEKNFLGNKKSHLELDKCILKKHFDLKGKDVLDFGCGMGSTSLWMAHEMNAHVDGVDLDPNHIYIARELNRKFNVPNVRFERRNILESPIAKQYDFIILNDVIEHIKETWIPPILDMLIHRNLKNKGIIFFSYPPWEGPYASHLNHVIKIPWVQFLPDRYIMSVIRRKNRKLVGSKDLLTEYRELNHMTHKKLMTFLAGLPVERVFRYSHSIFNRLSIFRETNLNIFPFSYLVSKELIALRKVVKENKGDIKTPLSRGKREQKASIN